MPSPEQPLTVSSYLVVRATGEMRVVKKRPALSLDEVAFPLTVSIPRTWGRVQRTTIDVSLPEPPDARVTIDEPEIDDP